MGEMIQTRNEICLNRYPPSLHTVKRYLLTDRISLDEAAHRHYDFIRILNPRSICLNDCTKLKTKQFHRKYKWKLKQQILIPLNNLLFPQVGDGILELYCVSVPTSRDMLQPISKYLYRFGLELVHHVFLVYIIKTNQRHFQWWL